VVGRLLTFALMVAVLSTRLHPVLVTVGMASGFWVAWNLQGATADGTGLFLVDSNLLGLTLLDRRHAARTPRICSTTRHPNETKE
jgi:hypothetical protein